VVRADSANQHDPLDPLRRFTPTPLRTRFRLGPTRVTVQTNDFKLLPIFPLDTGMDGPGARDLEWKIIRDHDAPGLLQEPLVLNSEELTIAIMGPACLLGVDHERGELVCFIGAEVDARTFQEVLVPYFCRLTKEVSGSGFHGREVCEGHSRIDA
jgi:hypothetical protein